MDFFIFEAKLIPSELLNESDFRKIQGGEIGKISLKRVWETDIFVFCLTG